MVMAKHIYKKTTRFELRCSPEELAGWQAVAHEHGASLAQYIRVCLAKEPVFSRKMQVDPALLRQIAAIGNNLNQLARWANAHKFSKDINPVEEEVRLIRKTLENLRDIGGSPC